MPGLPARQSAANFLATAAFDTPGPRKIRRSSRQLTAGCFFVSGQSFSIGNNLARQGVTGSWPCDWSAAANASPARAAGPICRVRGPAVRRARRSPAHRLAGLTTRCVTALLAWQPSSSAMAKADPWLTRSGWDPLPAACHLSLVTCHLSFGGL